MVDKNIALEALGMLCNAHVSSIKDKGKFRSSTTQQLNIKRFIPTVLDGDETSQVSGQNFIRIKSILESGDVPQGFSRMETTLSETTHFIDEEEFFHPQYDYDFTAITDQNTYRRGGEVYERPCGWQRFAIKVLDKYDSNDWLGVPGRGTQSVAGEWPVSYHGTSKRGADGIIKEFYQAGSGQVYGRGIYSTPYIIEAIHYAKEFTSCKDGKKYLTMLQNRINPEYREKHYADNYWLVRIPQGTSDDEEQLMVERAIRPYGLLIKLA